MERIEAMGALDLKAKLPSLNFIIKAAIAIFIVMLVIRFTPDSWGVKKWFTPTG
jgi:hypothetical protein